MKSIQRKGLTVAVCAGLFGLSQGAAALTLDKTFENAYIIEGTTEGAGATLEIFPYTPGNGLGSFFFAFYTQNEDTDGSQYWVVASDTYQTGQNVFEVDLITAEGGTFDTGADNETVGSGTLTVNSCSSISFDYSFATAGGKIEEGAVNLVPLAPIDECVYQDPFPATSCPEGTSAEVAQPGFCLLSGTLTSDVTLTNDNVYQLNGSVFVGEDLGASGEGGVSLFIEPGTVVVGATGQDALFVSRGNKLIARGTRHAPVVLTSAQAFTDPTTGDSAQWGGLVLNGQSTINAGQACGDGTPDCLESQGEGGSGLYGGVDENDSSGVLNYVRVEFAGNLISDLDELNGIAFQGTGAGTYVDYVQVHANADDGIEFFGGTTSAKHVVLTSIGDDSLDWTGGWRGNVQYALIQQGEESDRGIEADNFDEDNDALPRSKGRLANFTIQGGGGVTDHGALFREGTAVNFTHSIIVDGPGGRGDSCIDIDQDATFANAGTPETALEVGELTATGVFLDCADPFEGIEDDGPNEFSVQEWFEAQPFNDQLDIEFVNGYQLPEGSDLLNAPDVPRSLFPAFFDNAGFAGAVGTVDWTEGWVRYHNRAGFAR